jgi:hypothetical protein
LLVEHVPFVVQEQVLCGSGTRSVSGNRADSVWQWNTVLGCYWSTFCAVVKRFPCVVLEQFLCGNENTGRAWYWSIFCVVGEHGPFLVLDHLFVVMEHGPFVVLEQFLCGSRIRSVCGTGAVGLG